MIAIIVLWIILGIIAFIVIMLHFSITAKIDLDKSGFDPKVEYLFFDIYPRPPKKEKVKKSRKKGSSEPAKEDIGEPFSDDFDEFMVSLDDDFSDSDNDVMGNVQTADNTDIMDDEEASEEVKAENILTDDVQQTADNIKTIETDDTDSANDKLSVTKMESSDNITEVEEVQQSKPVKKKNFFSAFKREKKPKDKPKAKKSRKKKSKLDDLKEKYNVIKPYIPMGWKYFKKLLKTIRFTDTKIELSVGKEDAYEAAMLYGKVQGGLFNVIALISGIFTVKIKKADVNCIFNEKAFDYDIHTVVRVRPSTVIAICFCVCVNFLRIYLPKRSAEKKARKKHRKERELKAKAAAENIGINNLS